MPNKKFILLLFAMLTGVVNIQHSAFVFPTLGAQNSKKVKELNNKKAKLQQELKRSQNALTKTRRDVKKGQQTIEYLDREIEVRVQYIHQTEHELDSLEHLVDSVQNEIHVLDSVLAVKKEKFTHALRQAQGYRKVNSTLLFALSAKGVTQMYRRLRYTRQYALYERALGEAVQAKQIEMLELQNRLLALKSEMNRKMIILVEERAKLSRQQVEQQTQVKVLQKKAGALQKEVADRQAQIEALQKTIDKLVALEIEQARKKAEEERRRREAQNKGKNVTPTKPTTPTTTGGGKGPNSKWLTPEEQKLNGSFGQNKGRLPVPITGDYMIGAHYGANTSGHSNVVLCNKGTNYVGRQGARARTVFDGEVSAVFTFGGLKNVLVRHGSYISVYCNLSSVIVRKGQRVKARDLLGTVADDGNGRYVLHFQLRQETKLLNPEAWIGR